MSFVSSMYLDLARNWLRHLERLDLAHLVTLFTLDDISAKQLPNDLVVNYYRAGPLVRDLWICRVNVFKNLVEDREIFIHSDLDAIWLKNPIVELSEIGGLVFSQGTVWPKFALNNLGVTFCVGFFKVDYAGEMSQSVSEFFVEWHELTKLQGDDQLALNSILCNNLVPANIPYDFMNFQGQSFKVFQNTVTFADKKLNSPRISLLPFRTFTRMPHGGVYSVVHPILPKSADKKIQELRRLSLWIDSH